MRRLTMAATDSYRLAVAEAPLAALAKRVKESMDPEGILNPGRMD